MLGAAAVAGYVLLAAQDLPPWRVIETETIRGTRDQLSALSDGLAEDAEMLGFYAVNGDIRCDRISVSFENGHSRWLQLGDQPVFRQGMLYAFDLHEENSFVSRVNFICTAVAGGRVTMRILASDYPGPQRAGFHSQLRESPRVAGAPRPD